ncbi:MAG TPA: ATP-binding protein [Byssovorax sp.]
MLFLIPPSGPSTSRAGLSSYARSASVFARAASRSDFVTVPQTFSEHQTVLVTGATGTGKTYVACALAERACRRGFRAAYRRTPRLFDELRLARADGSYSRLLARLARVDVLVLDDFAIAPVAEMERRDLLELLEDRSAGARSRAPRCRGGRRARRRSCRSSSARRRRGGACASAARA